MYVGTHSISHKVEKNHTGIKSDSMVLETVFARMYKTPTLTQNNGLLKLSYGIITIYTDSQKLTPNMS